MAEIFDVKKVFSKGTGARLDALVSAIPEAELIAFARQHTAVRMDHLNGKPNKSLPSRPDGSLASVEAILGLRSRSWVSGLFGSRIRETIQAFKSE
ncbi:MAG TPA: hypothetical protein DCZ75_05340 [Geobacter sp.]|nr:hypothetical protein [Geobacter sp.]